MTLSQGGMPTEITSESTIWKICLKRTRRRIESRNGGLAGLFRLCSRDVSDVWDLASLSRKMAGHVKHAMRNERLKGF